MPTCRVVLFWSWDVQLTTQIGFVRLEILRIWSVQTRPKGRGFLLQKSVLYRLSEHVATDGNIKKQWGLRSFPLISVFRLFAWQRNAVIRILSSDIRIVVFHHIRRILHLCLQKFRSQETFVVKYFSWSIQNERYQPFSSDVAQMVSVYLTQEYLSHGGIL